MLHHRHRIKAHGQPHSSLPEGVRIFTWVRAIRWVGWGFGESLLPVFILMFSKTFAEMGLFSSAVDITSLICLPIIGLWADKVSAKRLILLSLFLYPLVGIGYFLAGVLGMAAFVVFARVANGVTWELENVGIETYYRRTADVSRMASSFGYLDMWSHVAWIVAALVGMGLVFFMPIHYLLLGIVPFSIVAYIIALRAPNDKVRSSVETEKVSLLRSYGKTVSEWRTWSAQLWLLGALVLFSAVVSSLMYFFVPIDAYQTGANLPMVVLITIFGSIPALFGYKIGRIADTKNNYALVAIGLIGVAVVSLGLFVFPYYWFKLVAILLMGVILEMFWVVESNLITTLGPAETYGRRGGAFEIIVVLGDLVAPLILGISLDIIGFGSVSLAIASVAIVLGAIYHIATIVWSKKSVA